MTPVNTTLDRLEDQISWYDRKSQTNHAWFKGLKVAGLVCAAIIPLAVGIGSSPVLRGFTGCLGVLVVVFEGLQSLYQFQHNWITYRSTCEELKHEKYLWFAKAGPYASPEKPDAVLAERVESLISREHAKWVSTQEEIGKKKAASGRA